MAKRKPEPKVIRSREELALALFDAQIALKYATDQVQLAYGRVTEAEESLKEIYSEINELIKSY